jgi:hypothetical protein
MDDGTLQVLVLIATAVGSLSALSQARTVVNQHKISEADSYSRQRTEWENLRLDWERCRLIALGPRRAKHFGVGEEAADELIAALEIYREIDARWLIASGVGSSEEFEVETQSSWDNFEAESIRAEELVGEYQRSSRKILAYLSEVASLILRGKVSVDSVYNAIGTDLIAIGGDIRSLVSTRWGSESGCVAPDNQEKIYCATLEIDEYSRRMGWGKSFRSSAATAERVLYLQGVLISHAFKVGDIDSVPDYHPEHGNFSLVTELSMPAKLALVWKTARKKNLGTAIRFTWRMASIGRKARRYDPFEFDNNIWKVVKRFLRDSRSDENWERRHRSQEQMARFVIRLQDFVTVPRMVAQSRDMARKLTDVRTLDAPLEIRERFPEDTSAKDVNSYWHSWYDSRALGEAEDAPDDDEREVSETLNLAATSTIMAPMIACACIAPLSATTPSANATTGSK